MTGSIHVLVAPRHGNMASATTIFSMMRMRAQNLNDVITASFGTRPALVHGLLAMCRCADVPMLIWLYRPGSSGTISSSSSSVETARESMC